MCVCGEGGQLINIIRYTASESVWGKIKSGRGDWTVGGECYFREGIKGKSL